YPPLLFQAMLDRDEVIHHVHGLQDPGEQGFVTGEELQADARAGKQRRWQDDGPVRPKGEFLKLDSASAKKWRVVQYNDVERSGEVYSHYRLDRVRVHVSRDDWLDTVAEFFREPLVNVLLIMVGIAGLILELKMPGVGLPGVIAAVCFVL